MCLLDHLLYNKKKRKKLRKIITQKKYVKRNMMLKNMENYEKTNRENKAYPAGNYLSKFNNKNTKTRCEICSKLTIKIPE